VTGGSETVKKKGRVGKPPPGALPWGRGVSINKKKARLGEMVGGRGGAGERGRGEKGERGRTQSFGTCLAGKKKACLEMRSRNNGKLQGEKRKLTNSLPFIRTGGGPVRGPLKREKGTTP